MRNLRVSRSAKSAAVAAIALTIGLLCVRPYRNHQLVVAVRDGDVSALEGALAHHADVEARDWWGRTALTLAVMHKNESCLVALIEHRADVNAVQNTATFALKGVEANKTVLMEAAESGNLRFVELLMANGAKINRRDEFGLSALSFAVRAGHTPMVKFLLSKGADPNVLQTWSGDSPLMWAAVQGYEEIAGLLLKHGANVTLKNRNGESPLSLAMKSKHFIIAHMIRRRLEQK